MPELSMFAVEITIITELSKKQNELIHLKDLYAAVVKRIPEMGEEKMHLESLKFFVTSVINMPDITDCIHLFMRDGEYYITQSTKTRESLVKEFNLDEDVPHELKDFITNDDYMNYIEYAIKNDIYFHPDHFINDDMNATQIIVKMGSIYTMKLFHNLYTLDFSIETKEGKSVFDLAKDKKDIEMLEYLYIIKCDQDTEQLKHVINHYREGINIYNKHLFLSNFVMFSSIFLNITGIVYLMY